jgi:hypothetical protein
MNKDFVGPIVVGGIGGSGTRVVAQILRELNIFIGDDLNESLDNLSYTLLFKRPDWFYKNRDDKRKIFRGLKIVEKAMLSNSPRFTILENLFLRNATNSMFKYGHNRAGHGKGEWAIERLNRIRKGRTENNNFYSGWGWKEPNTHLLLPYLNEYFPTMKYIHTVRNGLDMAFSSNQQQLFNWGPLYGIELPKNEDDITEASFRYWLAANKKVIEIGNTMGKKRFYLLNFEKLCNNSFAEILELLNFIGIIPESEIFKRICTLPNLPATAGRFKNHNTDWLNDSDLCKLNRFGYF